MTNDERMTNDEYRMTQRGGPDVLAFVIGHSSFIRHWAFVIRHYAALVVVLLCAAVTTAQDRVTVTRDEKTITLSNGLVEVVMVRANRMGVVQIYWIDQAGKKVALLGQGATFDGSAERISADYGRMSFTQAVTEHDDGSVTVVMLRWPGSDNRVTTYLHVEPNVAMVAWISRVENLSDQPRLANLSWDFVQPMSKAFRTLPLSDGAGWYLKDADVNALLLYDRAVTKMTGPVTVHSRGTSWLVRAESVALPAYSVFTSQITIGVASGIGPASAASDAAAISAAKDASGKWMIAVVPFGRLINAEITVTAGLKTYRQTVNAGPREPLVVDTPLIDEQITVELKAANGQTLLRSPPLPPEAVPPEVKSPEVANPLPPKPETRNPKLPPPPPEAPEVMKSEPAKTNMEQISKQRVEQMNAVLKAMGDKNYDAALMLARQMSGPMDGGLTGDTLWTRLMQVLAEQQAGHKDEAEKMLRRIVAEDPSAAEAWWLLGDEEKAGALGDVKVIRMTMDALRAGRLPKH